MKTNATGTGGTAAPGQPLDVVSAFAAILSPGDEDKQEGDEATAEANEEAAEAATEGAEANAEEAADKESEATEAQSDESEEQEASEPATKFTVRIDGKDEEVELSELLAGYSRTSDYTRKTQSLATERKTLEQELATARRERTEYAELLPKLRKAVEAGMGQEPDWEALRATDPVKASVEWQRWQERKQKVAQLQAEEDRVNATREQEAAADRNAVLIEQREKLLDKLPAWKDQKVAAAESEQISKALLAVGFTESELAIYDHRAILIALKAAKYDELQAKRSGLQTKIQKAPIVKPGGGEPTKRTAATAARDRFMKSGSVADAAGLFNHLI